MISTTSSQIPKEPSIFAEHPEAGVRSAEKNWDKKDSFQQNPTKKKEKESCRSICKKQLPSTTFIISLAISRKDRL